MTRTLVFTCLVVANIALTLVNRSFEHSLVEPISGPLLEASRRDLAIQPRREARA